MQTFALLDCNNFFASCERVFEPALRHKPVAILSNNDGCIVARSQEVKAANIPMGAPYFKYKDLLESIGAEVRSANFSLYSDLSDRVMDIIAQRCPYVQVYSVDEAFIDLTDLSEREVTNFAQDLARDIYRFVGIPVSIGIASTKTLAKVANHIAKKATATDVCNLFDADMYELDEALAVCEVGDVWGVGRQTAKKYNSHGIFTAYDLKYASPSLINLLTNIVGYRTYLEIRGVSCIGLERRQLPKKSIACTRSFGYRITELPQLQEAVTRYTSNAAVKLRSQGSVARGLEVFLHTNPHSEYEKFYYNTSSYRFITGTQDTRDLVQAAQQCLTKIYLPRYKYKKAGVILTEITPLESVQYDLLTDVSTSSRGYDNSVMESIDMLNRKWGRDTVRVASSGARQKVGWDMQRSAVSPRYTTSWSEIPMVYAR